MAQRRDRQFVPPPIPNTSTGSQQRQTLTAPAVGTPANRNIGMSVSAPTARRQTLDVLAAPTNLLPPNPMTVLPPGTLPFTQNLPPGSVIAGTNTPVVPPASTPTPATPSIPQVPGLPPTTAFSGQGLPQSRFGEEDLAKFYEQFLFGDNGRFLDPSIPASLAGLSQTIRPFETSPIPLSLTELAFQNLIASPEQRFQNLPFSQFLQQAVEGGQIPGVQGGGVADQFLQTSFEDALSGSSLPFREDLASLVSQLGDPNASVFGQGLTEQERGAQSALLQSTLTDARDDLLRDLKADAARRGLTSADAPALENLARFDERSAELAADLANQQLLQDMQLRRDAARLGLERQLGAAGIGAGQQLRDIQGALGLGNLALGTSGLGRETGLREFQTLADVAGRERLLGSQLQQEAFQNAFTIPQFAASAGLNFLNSNRDADFIRQSIERGDAAGLGAFIGGNQGSPFGINIGLPNINFPNPTGPRFDLDPFWDFGFDERDFAGIGGRPPYWWSIGHPGFGG